MTFRSILAIAVAVLVALLAVIALIFGHFAAPLQTPSLPGNYVLLADDGPCELHVVRTDQSNIVIRPSECRPAASHLSIAAGFTASTSECGPLTFALSLSHLPAASLLCTNCSAASQTCPLATLDIQGVMLWELVE